VAKGGSQNLKEGPDVATGVKRFEDLIAWQQARLLTKAVYGVTRKGLFARDYGLRDQIRKAGVSIMSNIAEGFERGTSAEFHNFLRIAKGSCAEVRSQLYVAFDAEYLDEKEFLQLLQQAEEVGRVVGGLRASIERYCNH
jgi:four helix bundle protein